MQRLVIQWTTFGPYHAARLNALKLIGAEQGLDVIGLQTASRDKVYGFSAKASSNAVVTAFPDAVFDEIGPRAISREVARVLDEIDPVAVGITSYSYPDARACLEWCKANRRIAILMTDSKEDAGTRRAWREWIKRRLVEAFDAALVAGAPHKRYLVKLGFPAEAIFDGYNVVDNDHFARGAEAARSDPAACAHLPGLGSSIPFFLAAGRMTETKNYEGLLQAYRQYRESTENPWRLVIIGDGPLSRRLEDRVQEWRIDDVTFAGRRPYSELPAYYGLAGALVHAAWVDTWGLVVNEAMASGLPILCSTGAGCWENLVRDGENGYTFAPGETDRLARLMVRLSSSKADLALMRTTSELMIRDWPPERFADGFLQALDHARDRSFTPPTLALRAILKVLFWIAKSPTSFHSIRP